MKRAGKRNFPLTFQPGKAALLQAPGHFPMVDFASFPKFIAAKRPQSSIPEGIEELGLATLLSFSADHGENDRMIIPDGSQPEESGVIFWNLSYSFLDGRKTGLSKFFRELSGERAEKRL
ncbi:hypothetical protein [Beijerinckia mobilis]|uniref:hypothetical protein n=1 Tax=Beijerinckia mobilis TaxID=231434 RepID=UPI0012EBB3D1|nr:hypothetical protein [Beijerinckia mobilis]